MIVIVTRIEYELVLHRITSRNIDSLVVGYKIIYNRVPSPFHMGLATLIQR